MLLNILNYIQLFFFKTNLGKRFVSYKPTVLNYQDSLKQKKAVFNTTFLKKFFYKKVSEYALFQKSLISASQKLISNTQVYFVKFKPSDLSVLENSYDNSFFKNSNVFLFLRKHKLFNKGRFSRNRQTYRTGAYWCLWVNILAVTGFYYWFYRFTMNFGYLWPFFALFVISFILPRALKYNYLILTNLFESIYKLFVWFYLILSNAYKAVATFLLSFLSSNISFFFSLNSLFSLIVSLVTLPSLFLMDKKDLLIKKYSHWNYFLPLRWIHRNHRLFFYKRIYYTLFGEK